MSSGNVARWLDTILCNNRCKQYVEVFKRNGYETFDQVCGLEATALLKMGVAQIDCEKIMENVSVLRQTLKVQNISNQVGYQNYHVPNENKFETHMPMQHMQQMKPIEPLISVPAPIAKTPRKSKAKVDKQKQMLPNVTINQVGPNGIMIATPSTAAPQPNSRKAKSNARNAKNIVNNTDDVTHVDMNNPYINSSNNSNSLFLNIHNQQQLQNHPQHLHHHQTQLQHAAPASSGQHVNRPPLHITGGGSNPDMVKRLGNDIVTQHSHANAKYTLGGQTQQPSINPASNYNAYDYHQYHHQQYNNHQNTTPNYQQQQQQQQQQAYTPNSYTNSNSNTYSSSRPAPPGFNSTNNANNSGYYQYSSQSQQQQQAPPPPYNTYYSKNNNNNNTTSSTANTNSSTSNNNNNNWNSNNLASSNSTTTATNLGNNSSNSNEFYTPYNAHQQTNKNNAHLPPSQSESSFQIGQMNNKNSPLEYLERLALLPETQTAIDPKNLLTNEPDLLHHQQQLSFASVNAELDPQAETVTNRNNKRNLLLSNNDSSSTATTDLSLASGGSNINKKLCSSNSNSNSNSPISKSNLLQYGTQPYPSNGNDFVNHRYTNNLNDSSPSSTCSTTSSSSAYSSSSAASSLINVNLNQFSANSNSNNAANVSSNNGSSNTGGSTDTSMVSANLIDACNFDFLDFLPELNSSTIDQTINDFALGSDANLNPHHHQNQQYYGDQLASNEFSYNNNNNF